ncbi:MAG: sugar transferase, partial [Anaerolineae bacterium]|nr:sugar transferase [Anaerolineae bacterium]
MPINLTTKTIPISKRLFDFLVSLVGLILLSPVILILMVLVWINLGGPVIFAQVRPGYRGKLFKLFKFRSMRNVIDAEGNPLPDEQRLTKFGKFLRASSLDELPEL